MNPRHEALLALLADGALHSSADLAPRDSASVVPRCRSWWASCASTAWQSTSLPRSGYRLPQPVELLDAGRIRGALDARGWPLADRLQVLFETGSTNTFLYDAPAPPPARPRVVFAELQQAGRGRRGRSWLAPFGSGLTFSIAWTFADTPPGLPALGLAIGVGIAEALRTPRASPRRR